MSNPMKRRVNQMALVPIISQTWDTNSVFNPTRMNNIEQNIANWKDDDLY